MYASWTAGGVPDYYVVNLEESYDNSSYTLVNYQFAYYGYESAEFPYLTENYYYRFYVVSHYGFTYEVSSNSDPSYVYSV